ncbi:MAG: FtsX-like permease family protein [Clostridia bacterium]|nr:FtsX-like permease family protein [Clostridia bacterium]
MLKRKLWRDIKGNYGAYVACISVLVIGMMLYVSLSLTLDSMNTSIEDYYRKHDFAQGFARIVKGSAGLTEDLARVKGINQVMGRVVQDVMVYRPEGEDTTTVRLVSFSGPDQPLNRFRLEGGRIPVAGEKEIMVSPAFLAANKLQFGDMIPLIIKGREVKFRVTGAAISPEYIYEIPNGLTLAPDPKAFGVGFVPYSTVAPLLEMDGQINDLTFTLEDGNDFRRVEQPVTRVLEHYGLSQLNARKDQLSHSMLEQEMVGLKASASTTPVIFLLVAAGILYIMLRRMVEQQRGQIGILKAFGFNNREIIGHYLGYALLIGGLGGLLGGLAGSWMSYAFAKLYQQFYNIPDLKGQFSLTYLVVGLLLSLGFSVIAGYQGCKGVLVLSPAEAMRPPAPKAAGRTWLEKIQGFWEMLNTQGKMAVRNVFRNKQRSILTVIGIACAFSIMVSSRAMFDTTYFLINFQYDQVEKYDLKISLQQYVDKTQGITAGKHLEGVREAEAILEVPVTISHKWLEKDTAVIGLSKESKLYRLLNQNGEPVAVPDSGLVISNQLAKILNVKPGDMVTVKPFLGDRKERLVTVRKVVPQYVGLGAYMEIDALSKVLQAPPVTSAILLKLDQDKVAEVRKYLQGGQNVLGIFDKTKMKAQFEQLMESTSASQAIMLSFSFITGFAIVYNVNLIALSERERELATLMVLGMTEREIGRILVIEQGILSFVGVLLGIPLSYGMLSAIADKMATDIFNMPVIMEPGSLALGFVGAVLFLLAAQWKTKGKISQLSMLDVLKQQE